MSNRSRRGGFAITHQTCPCPLHETKCYSVFADDPCSGYCFACAKVVHGNSNWAQTTNLDRTGPRPDQQLFIPHDEVMCSSWQAVDFVSTFSDAEGYQEAFRDYAELKSQGFDHPTACRVSGFGAFTRSRLTEIADLLRSLPGFFQKLICRAGVPNILTAFNVGQSNNGAILFWIVDSIGRVCNAQSIYYHGLKRATNWNTSYKYRSADGYKTSAFFGAEQLQRDAVAWTLAQFGAQAPICIVESPKSAMLASILHPEIIWLASCGSSGVTRMKALALRGREVRIMFDNDTAGHVGALRAKQVLIEAGAYPSIVNPETAFGGPRPEGWDIGDEVIQKLGGDS